MMKIKAAAIATVMENRSATTYKLCILDTVNPLKVSLARGVPGRRVCHVWQRDVARFTTSVDCMCRAARSFSVKDTSESIALSLDASVLS